MNIGDLIITGKKKNYNDNRKSEYVYFAGTLDAAILGAELADGDGAERIYVVEPTGEFEDAPNVTDKKVRNSFGQYNAPKNNLPPPD